MTTQTPTTTKPPGAKTDVSSRGATAEASSRVATLGTAVSDVAGTVKSAADDAAARLPEVAASTRSLIEEATREIRGASDERIVVGSALTFGLAGGLLLGGANRILVAVALMPAAMLVLTVLDRSNRILAQAGKPQQRS